jgi:hypothetical protein
MGWTSSSIAQVGSSFGKTATPEEIRPWPRAAPTVRRNDGLVKRKSRIFCHLRRNVFRAFLPTDDHVGLLNPKPRHKVKTCVTKLHETPKNLVGRFYHPQNWQIYWGKLRRLLHPANCPIRFCITKIHNKEDSEILLGWSKKWGLMVITEFWGS